MTRAECPLELPKRSRRFIRPLPLAGKLAVRVGIVSQPANDRWHRTPTPLLGGLSIAVGTIAAVVLFAPIDRSVSVMTLAGVLALLLGLVDDKVKCVGGGYLAGRFDQIDFLKQPRGGQSQYAFEVTSNAIFGELHVQRQLSGSAGGPRWRDVDARP